MSKTWEIVDSLDGVDDSVKDQYEEFGGAFRRQVEVEDVSGLKSALQKERDARKTFEKRLDKLKDVDPEKYQEMLKKQEEGLSELERYENALKKKEQETKELKEKYDADLASANQKLKKFHADRLARKAAIKSGVQPEDVDDVLILTQDQRSLDDEGNVIIIDSDGDPTGKTLEEFFSNDFKKAKPRYYAGIPGGGGSTGGDGKKGDKLITRKAFDQLDPIAKKEFALGGGKVVNE